MGISMPHSQHTVEYSRKDNRNHSSTTLSFTVFEVFDSNVKASQD